MFSQESFACCERIKIIPSHLKDAREKYLSRKYNESYNLPDEKSVQNMFEKYKKVIRNNKQDLFDILSQLQHDNSYDVILNELNQTIVHIAAEQENFEVLNLIFSKISNLDSKMPNSVDKNGNTWFHIACMSGNTTSMWNIFRSNLSTIDVNASLKDTGLTPLHLAVLYGRVNAVEFLIKKLCLSDLNQIDSQGRTALHLACCIPETMLQIVLPKYQVRQQHERLCKQNAIKFYRDMREIVMMLLEAEPSATMVQDFNGDTPASYIFKDFNTPLHLEKRLPAESLDFQWVWRKFTKIQREINSITRSEQRCKLEMFVNLKTDNVQMYSKIFHQILDDVKKMRQLREYWTPLIYKYSDSDHCMMIKLLLDYGVPVDTPNEHGETPLEIAVKVISADIVAVLLKYGAKLSRLKFKFNHEQDVYFYYPNVLPNYETTDMLFRIVDLLTEFGFEFDKEAKLVLLRFLIINNINCDYIDPKFEVASYRLTNLLDFGTQENIIKSLEKISDKKDIRYPGGLVTNHVHRYLMKIKDHKFFLEEKFENYLRSYINDTWLKIDQKEMTECRKEAEKFQRWDCCDRNICSIFRTSSYELIYKVYKEAYLARNLNHIDFTRKYPLNHDFIKSYFCKSLIRRFVLDNSLDFIEEAMGVQLPYVCYNKILKNLSNDDLWRMCLSVKNTQLNFLEISIGNINLSDKKNFTEEKYIRKKKN